MVDVSKIDELIQPFNRSDAPGLVIGVSHKGRTVYRRGVGLACVQSARVNTPATRMRIGSTTKHFACLAALLIAEEGALDVDAPADRYLPELPALEAMPTLRNFMTHTSGFRCSLEIASLANGRAFAPKGWAVATLARQRGANFPLNQGQTYCNGGYHLLSLAIERAAGMPFEAVLKTRIFDPLGMNDTIGAPSDHQLIPGAATLHVPDGAGGWRRGFFTTDEVRGEGNLISTVGDMLIWMAHFGGDKRIGSPEVWRQMLVSPVLENGFQTNYSLGLMNYTYRGVDVIAHSGGVIGGNSEMIMVPEHDLNIAIMVNGALVSANALAKKVIDVVLADALGPVTKLADAQSYAHMSGAYYQGASGLRIGFETVGDDLGASFLGYPAMPILSVDGDYLRVPFEVVALGPLAVDARTLAADETGKPPASITLIESGYPHDLKLLEPLTADEALQACEALVGDYTSWDLNADIQVRRIEDGYQLIIKGDYSSPRPLHLSALSSEAFTAKDDGVCMAVLVLREQGRVSGLQMDSIRARCLTASRLQS